MLVEPVVRCWWSQHPESASRSCSRRGAPPLVPGSRGWAGGGGGFSGRGTAALWAGQGRGAGGLWCRAHSSEAQKATTAPPRQPGGAPLRQLRRTLPQRPPRWLPAAAPPSWAGGLCPAPASSHGCGRCCALFALGRRRWRHGLRHHHGAPRSSPRRWEGGRQGWGGGGNVCLAWSPCP